VLWQHIQGRLGVTSEGLLFWRKEAKNFFGLWAWGERTLEAPAKKFGVARIN
jgi:hypothetical protein